MQSNVASLHSGLLARKGEARPAIPRDHAVVARGDTESTIRREPLTGTATPPTPARQIELPRRHTIEVRPRKMDRRRNIHARVAPDLHLKLKIAAAHLDRTQQSIVTAALDAYLFFLDEDVITSAYTRQNAEG